MLAIPANVPARGRAPQRGAIWRALPLLMIIALFVSGTALTAKALYIPVKAEVAQILLARAFEQSVARGSPVKPWSWADTAPIARVTVPRLGRSEFILSGGSGEAMAFGPTALVEDVSRGVTVLAAHRDTHFRFVQDLNAGDLVKLERIDGSSTIYRVTHLETVRWDEFSHPAQHDTGILALTTCFPFDTHTPGPLRRVAWAEAI